MYYTTYHLTAATCPCNTLVHSPVSTSHTLKVASREPLTTVELRILIKHIKSEGSDNK